MAFFSSYAYLNEVFMNFTDKYPSINTVVQKQDLDEEGRDEFLSLFKEDPDETVLFFVVMGGVFSEGIDLKGTRLIGAAVVGVGLPLISAERNIIMDYYNRFDDKGFDFTYIYPGMNKVMQAAGRVIRTETDRGVVLLIDGRFTQDEYRSLFPPEWDGFTVIKNGADFTEKLRIFWNESN
jgi:DNA excision repair protein ERCC-2